MGYKFSPFTGTLDYYQAVPAGADIWSQNGSSVYNNYSYLLQYYLPSGDYLYLDEDSSLDGFTSMPRIYGIDVSLAGQHMQGMTWIADPLLISPSGFAEVRWPAQDYVASGLYGSMYWDTNTSYLMMYSNYNLAIDFHKHFDWLMDGTMFATIDNTVFSITSPNSYYTFGCSSGTTLRLQTNGGTLQAGLIKAGSNGDLAIATEGTDYPAVNNPLMVQVLS